VDVEYIGKYKDERAYSYWMSGFVDIIHVAKNLYRFHKIYTVSI
jgi:hypothetical protein